LGDNEIRKANAFAIPPIGAIEDKNFA